MSKHLVKILSFCALIVLIPLIVVGSALCVTEAAPATLTVYQGGNEGSYDGKSSNITISVDGVPQIDEDGAPLSTITLKKHTEVTVSYEGTGYEFLGWYQGNPQEIDGTETPISTQTSTTVKLNGNTVITALRNYKQYQIQYSGTYDNGASIGSVESDHISTEVQFVEYNQPLAQLTSQTGAVFSGWYVYSQDASVTTGTTVANFSEASKDGEGNYITLTLRPIWSNYMIFRYYASDRTTVIAEENVTSETLSSYQLLASDSDRVLNALTDGYRFEGWVDISGNAINISEIDFATGVYPVYLSESSIDYTLNVRYNALSDQTTTITYNVERGYDAYNQTRDYYTFVGLNYNGTLYELTGSEYVATSGTLADVITSSSETILDVTAVWDCELPDIAWQVGFGYETTLGTDGLYYFNGSEYIPLADRGGDDIIYFEDEEGEYSADITDNLLDRYFPEVDLNQIYRLDGGDYVQVNLSTICIYDNVNSQVPHYVGDTAEYLINATYQYIFENMGIVDSNTECTKLIVVFIFE